MLNGSEYSRGQTRRAHILKCFILSRREKNMTRYTLRAGNCYYVRASVSGWRCGEFHAIACVASLSDTNCTSVFLHEQRSGNGAARHLELLNASPERCQEQGGCSVCLQASGSRLKCEHVLSKHLPVAWTNHSDATAELMGDQLLVTYKPLRTSSDRNPTPSLSLWRL